VANTGVKTQPRMPAPSLLYLYGVVRPDFDPSRAPAGLDDERVETLRAGAHALLVSRVSASAYAPEVVERRSGEMDWITPRAMAHDRVLSWAQMHGGIVPMSMFSLWSEEGALTQSIAAKSDALGQTFARVGNADEYGLRVHRRDREMATIVHELDPEIASLRRDAAAATPGQRYLIERKIAERSKQAIRAAAQRLARDAYEALKQHARESKLLPATPSTSAPDDTTLVLNAAFLVARDRLDAFRAEVATHATSAEPRGLTFDFTGPWPPYNFVS